MNNPFDKLVKAVKKADISLVAELLQDQSININDLDHKSGKSVLQIAMENSQQQIFHLLIKFPHLDPNLVNKTGQSLIEVAIMVNDVGFLQKILQRGINIKKKNVQGQSALQTAVKNKINPQIIKKLIHHGFDVNQKVYEHGSLLHLAIACNQAENFMCLLEQPNIEIKNLDDDDNTCLLLAVKLNRGDIIISILQKLKQNKMTEMQKQFFINAQDFEGNTALIVAYMKDLQTISGILEREGKVYGIDKSIKNKQGKTCQIIIEERAKERQLEKMNQNRRKQQKITKRRQKDEEKLRIKNEEERIRKEEKKKKKIQEEQLRQNIKVQEQTTKSKLMWGAGIGFIAILGLMYLLILNSIQKKP